MAHLPLDDLLDNPAVSGTVDPGLEATLRRLRAAAEDQETAQTGHYETFDVTVSPRGDVTVDTSAPNSFGDWVWAAGDLAHHIGPRSGVVHGETRTVEEILGTPEGEAASPSAGAEDSPAASMIAAPLGLTPVVAGSEHTLAVTPRLIFLCARCGSFLEAMPLGHRCSCGGEVTAREAVRCPGCSRLLVIER